MNNVVSDSDNNIWFDGCAYDSSGNQYGEVGVFNTTTDTTSFHSMGQCYLGVMATGPNNTVWVEYGAHVNGWSAYIYAFTSDNPFSFTTEWTSTPITNGYSEVQNMAEGANSTMWFTDSAGATDQIYDLTISSTNSVTSTNIYSAPVGGAYDMTLGSDGNIWFMDDNEIDNVTPSGTFTEHTLPSGFDNLGFIAPGPDGALWFTDSYGSSANEIGRITTTGSITEYELPTPTAQVSDIVAGPDNAMWFTESNESQIGRIGY